LLLGLYVGLALGRLTAIDPGLVATITWGLMYVAVSTVAACYGILAYSVIKRRRG
jgi:hypothetical protein